MQKVSIIIVNWNGHKDTLTCLSSLQKLKAKDFSTEIIIVDNGSTDDSVSSIRRKFPEINLVELDENLGFTGGNNAGIHLALEHNADFIWLLNNDTIVDPRALDELANAFTESNVGIAGSKIYFASGHEYHRDRYKQSERGKVFWYAGGQIDWDNMYASHRGVDEVDSGQYDKTEETSFVTGCSMMIRASVIHKIGAFDEAYYLYLEDLDFCLRAQRAGYKTVFVSSSKIWHVNAGSSGGPGSRLHEYFQTRNRFLVGMRFAPLRTKFALFRQALWFLLKGSSIQQKAVKDFLFGKWGKQSYEF